MATDIADRLRWAVQILDVQPDDHILEIGSGHGIGVSLICEKLTSGKITAIDQSDKMIAAAHKRNRECIAADKADFKTVALKDAALDDATFNKIFAVNVNVFWQQPERELDVIKRLLKPNGVLYIFYQPPTSAKAYDIANQVQEKLAANGYTVVDTQFEDFDSGTTICIRATNKE
ncbi:MAG: class I SAM-dependent methyltransferase [Chloroflexi bacterium]|nr:class I SAM-dependent methyltransferase [Chloroflexota bacterium]